MTRNPTQVVIVVTTSRKEAENDSELKEFFECRETAESLRNTKRIESISAEDVAAVVLIGGHGCLIDFPNCEGLHKLCSNVWYRSEGVLGAIAQGSVGLAYMKNDRGEPFLKNKKITCMSNEEEKSFKEELPFYVEEKMEQLGVQVENQQAFKPNVIVDSQRLITAQNPQSSRQFADKLHQTIRQYAEKV
ncbi:class I glutamine amidotransferase-like protein [Rozella allomycis CSF55]|uniref:D-lactate dehydratase n=1 Tax=Rozella allomycis (strain CSF55) TaxID=988480 RepID=A0A4P9YEZ1_ROZAC|nr:class I glutamine amidotransferase-like protein [Rozella allomycis CSF55]